jgi:hypothetical protein
MDDCPAFATVKDFNAKIKVIRTLKWNMTISDYAYIILKFKRMLSLDKRGGVL